MDMTENAGIQHYVPQFLLRNFCGRGKSRLFAFDKATGKVFEPSVRNVGGEHGFYDFGIAGVTISVDPILRALEDATAPIIQKIVLSESLGVISADERTTIAQFAAAQAVRCTHTRIWLEELSKAISNELQSRGIDPLRASRLLTLSAQDAKLVAIHGVLDLDELAGQLGSMDWLLFRSSDNNFFIISDNPVATQSLQNGKDVGAVNRGVEIYLPISRKLAIVFLNSRLRDYCREGIRLYEGRSWKESRTPEFDLSPLKGILHAIGSGESLKCNAENVKNVNSLQVKSSERFVFSGENDFSLVREMLESGRYQQGPRPRVF